MTTLFTFDVAAEGGAVWAATGMVMAKPSHSTPATLIAAFARPARVM
jgi:hypothetical protein